MTCHRCSKEIDTDSVFCRHCGAAVHETGQPQRLTRRPSEGKLGGAELSGLRVWVPGSSAASAQELRGTSTQIQPLSGSPG